MNRAPNSSKPPSAAARSKKKKRTNPLGVGFSFLFAATFFLVLGTLPLFRPMTVLHHAIRVDIPKGSGVSGAGEELEKRGVIRSGWAFLCFVRFHGESAHIKAGRYTLSSDMNLAQIVQELKLGGGKSTDNRVKVTFPEGYTLRQTADLLAEKDILNSDEFVKFARSRATFSRIHTDFPLHATSLEGYLFPDTYYFHEHSQPERVAELMIMNFYTRFARPYHQELQNSISDLNSIVTVASLIEREAKVPQDRARIAGVIQNRLDKGMRLEIDATVLYALGHHKDRVLFNDLKIESPYNTYRVMGLPPGPIANPGLPSLLAALHPEKNDYIYYVARASGSHIFTRTANEHEAAKKEVRLDRVHPRLVGEGHSVE